MLWVLLSSLVASGVNGASIEYSIGEDEFTRIAEDSLTVVAGSRLRLRCKFPDLDSNSSVLWDISAKRWRESWMNVSQMGLKEESLDGVFSTEVYINAVNAQDVGSYECTESSDIDLDLEGVYIYVMGDALTPLDSSNVAPLRSGDLVPCTPAHAGIKVSLLGDGEDLTSVFDFDPRSGFSVTADFQKLELASSSQNSIQLAPEKSEGEISSRKLPSSYTCYFDYQDKIESVHFKAQRLQAQATEFSVTIHVKQADPEDNEVNEIDDEDEGDEHAATLVCKVKSIAMELSIEVKWEVPPKPDDLLSKSHPDLIFNDRWRIEEEYIEDVYISTLAIKNPHIEDQGIYRCQASTLDGKSESAETYLEVEDDAASMTTFKPLRVQDNSSASLISPNTQLAFILLCKLLLSY